MTKRELIDEIIRLNRSALPAFLAHFSDDELTEYLEHLKRVQSPRISGQQACYGQYVPECRVEDKRPAGRPDRPTVCVAAHSRQPAAVGADASPSPFAHSSPIAAIRHWLF